MLQALTIRDFVIVERLDLEFADGYTTLTGETGAGKSILIDALSLTLGARNDGGVTRAGCDKAEIITTFDVEDNQAVQDWFEENALDAEASLILRRVIYADGRSRAFINGVASTVAQLKSVGAYLIDIYSQNAHHSLMQAQVQRDILDAYAGLAVLRKEVATHYIEWHQLHLKKIDAEKNASAYEDELAELRDKVQELTQLDFTLESWEQLQQDHNRLANGAGLIAGVESSLDILASEERGANGMLVQVLAKLVALQEIDPSLKEVVQNVDTAVIQLEDATRDLNRYLQDSDLDSAKLEETEAHIQQVHQFTRKYRTQPETLPAMMTESQARITTLEAFSADGALQAAEAAAFEAYQTIAKKLTDKRSAAAKQLGQEITAEMQRLSLAGGQFAVQLSSIEPSRYGGEVVDFLVAGHAGVTPRPLNKVASGGELSRISLALHVVTATKGSVPCMIFDEVDVGIGGAVAEVVGQLLKQLGQQRQVLVITHLAQVAAQAQQHLQVSKTQADGVTLSHIKPLDQAARIEEVARMIGGVEMTDATLNHAKEMLGH